MKTLIFSDTHLGRKFEPAKLDYLQKIIAQADRVIINGDFWEGYEFTFDEFLDSKWNKLFPLLKQKQTIYLTGNHDLIDWVDKQKALVFCDEVKLEHRFTDGGQKYQVQHGHLLSPTEEMLYPRVFANRFMIGLGTQAQKILMLTSELKFLEKRYDACNQEMIANGAKELSDNEILITGHSHLMAQTDNFINDGCFINRFAQYVWIENGQAELIDDRY